MSHRLAATTSAFGGVKLAGILGGGTASVPDLDYSAFAPDQAVDFNSQRITGVASPTADTDAVNMAWVLAQIGKIDFKGDVDGVSTTNFVGTYNAGTITASANGAIDEADFDDVTLASDGTEAGSSIVLLTGQTDAKENGLYFVKALGDVGTPAELTRVSWFDEDAEISGAYVHILPGGTAHANSVWLLTTLNPEIGTDNLAFTKSSSVALNSTDNVITTIQPDAAAAAGASAAAAKADHTHAIAAAAPDANGSLAAASAEGDSTSFARADHVHSTIPASDGVDMGTISARWDVYGRESYTGVTYLQATTLTLGDGHSIVAVDDDTAAGAVTITLPTGSANLNGRVFKIKKMGTTANVTVQRASTDTIDGAVSVALTDQYQALTLVWCHSASMWIVL